MLTTQVSKAGNALTIASYITADDVQHIGKVLHIAKHSLRKRDTCTMLNRESAGRHYLAGGAQQYAGSKEGTVGGIGPGGKSKDINVDGIIV